ncbi:glycerol-3-phosphate dehydrogenase (NAD(P)(+)) [Paucilactobacillus oligofermentans DSM 15707 = LMG 22743]|uniref:Glycerol-3-phosphate dehydrogenase [NAD(P)+] n=1 Tax=Paucilactobacillus oligofermentans DSM 15707 = LMG 22743 TaxID=1423778 RepID=A0A0R1RLV0_9LACO|nr:NAD(P)H-dependent glycerol-3-phosphate dehydrogenase [Paucilactobacillus oligofermentans]KRL57830.1 glycerol-3-phosphate dehydrogenase (NAD(P)(+)) [Paucilactobacillus oligofermentans DSM 15707 = LMG 22743]CUS26706.1 Putative glycerol-3-phosphate dehydrogenase [NAD(P) ] [Paucilactobacillus oligofermentans DSM 15707 = LMG 22743]
MTEKIAVLGAGSWGSVLANLLSENGHDVYLWSHNPEQVNILNDQHENPKYMKDFKYSTTLTATGDMEDAIKGASVVLIAIPTGGIREVSNKVGTILAKLNQTSLVLHATKGLEQVTYKRPSEILAEEIPAANRRGIVAITGPSHAEDVARKDLTAITAASADESHAKEVQVLFNNDYFRIYSNDDIVGAEFGSALKNIIAIGSGILSGMGYRDNAKAALITRGLNEIKRLGVAYGANPFTFSGLSGVGDLIVTATSVNSRNWRAGNQLGQGKSLDDVIEDMGMVIEGVYTTKAAYEMSQERHVEMPIIESIYKVLYENADVKVIINGLMQRHIRSERD